MQIKSDANSSAVRRSMRDFQKNSVQLFSKHELLRICLNLIQRQILDQLRLQKFTTRFVEHVTILVRRLQHDRMTNAFRPRSHRHLVLAVGVCDQNQIINDQIIHGFRMTTMWLFQFFIIDIKFQCDLRDFLNGKLVK